ncbi:NAD(P)-binding protein [Kocuria rosea]|uniref:NAD(P)-binding protein n=1 Tax=Kocuria rosea TaxID=1275 RepID=UPI0035AF5916
MMLARAGLEVTVHEAGDAPGGACRSGRLLGEGVISDLGAAAHPLGVVSPVRTGRCPPPTLLGP